MFGTDFTLALGSFEARLKPRHRPAGEHKATGIDRSEFDSGGRASNERNKRDRRSRSSSSLSPAYPGVNANLPDLTVAVGVHSVARIDLEHHGDQPGDTGLGRVRDRLHQLGQVQDASDALVHPERELGATVPSRPGGASRVWVGYVGDRTVVWGVGEKDE